MKSWEIFRFEFKYQAGRWITWLLFIAFAVISIMMTRDGMLSEALHDEFLLTSPFSIAKTTVVGCMFWLLVSAVVAGDAGARDVATGMHPLVYTAAISKAQYLGGRFLAAVAINTLMMLIVQLGIVIGIYAPGVDAELIGPFRISGYLTSFVYISLPNIIFSTAIQFLIATRSGRPMAGYLGSLILFFMAYVVGIFLMLNGHKDLTRYLDPVGLHFILSDLSYQWTTIEKSTRLITLEGIVLTNRLIWMGIGLAALTITYTTFQFAHRTSSTWWWKRKRQQSPTPSIVGVTSAPPVVVPGVYRSFTFGTQTRQTFFIGWTSFKKLAFSWGGGFMLILLPLLTIPVVADQMMSDSIRLVPTTVHALQELTGPIASEFSRWIIIPLLIIFFAGELIWRERDARLGEMTDVMPVADWVPFLGKFLGIVFLLLAFTIMQMLASMTAQTILGYHNYEIGLYLKVLFGLQLTEYILFAVIPFIVHVIVDQKYIGHLASIMAFVVIALSSMFGIEHNLLVYTASPAWSYTEMRGFGATLGPWIWFKLYWVGWGLLLVVVTRIMWVRGKENKFRDRVKLATLRLTPATLSVGSLGMAAIIVFGGFVFLNTNILNEYRTKADSDELSADYERLYSQYKSNPQPRVVAAELNIELYPEQRAIDVEGTYSLENNTGRTIQSIHVATVPGIEIGEMTLSGRWALTLNDNELGHRIYVLEPPMSAGSSAILKFTAHLEPKGFRADGTNTSITANSTFLNLSSILPAIGYQSSRELSSPAERRKHGLAPKPLIPSLYEPQLASDRPSGVLLKATIGTSEDQIAVMPGVARHEWTKNGRRYFFYFTDAPIGDEWTFASAKYDIYKAEWKNPDSSDQVVDIRIYHHPSHDTQLDRMTRSIRASLDYYTKNYGPYPFSHLTVVERPGNGTGLHADMSLVTFTEGVAHWTINKPGTLDLAYAVMTHEIGHQWNAPSARIEGAPVMSESVAWYYGMQAVEASQGRAELLRLLKFMHEPYPFAPIRRGEPLLRGLDPYLSYRRGPFALYILSEYAGDEKINGALRRVLAHHRKPDAPLATTLDMYRELKKSVPDSLHYLLHDLFEVNTFWQLNADRVTGKQTPMGEWEVTLEISARKVVADSAGVETEIPMDEYVPIGVFGPDKSEFELSDEMYLQLHRIRTGKQTITITVPREPNLAGIDPYHMLDVYVNDDDNNIEVVKKDKKP
ncbi:MAG TPA: ABC transporter permease [Cyclobacteriaceae bacterium]|nr:ABC transporter permease [Cyclobacteriaceae bacterium]